MIDPNEFPSPCGVCGLKSLDGTGDYRPDNSVSVPLRGLWFEIFRETDIFKEIMEFPSPCGVCGLKSLFWEA